MKPNQLVLLLVLAFPAHGVDLDKDAARAAYDRQMRVVDQAQSTFDQIDSTYQSALGDLRQAQSERQRAKRALDRERQRLSDIRSTISSLQSQIRSIESSLRTTRDEYRVVHAEVQSLKQKVEDLEDREDRIRKRVRQLERRVNQLENAPGKGPWTCTYVDKGWEEHAGGHQATHKNKSKAQSQAEKACLEAHGSCKFSSCRQPPSPALKQARRQLKQAQERQKNIESNLRTAQRDLRRKQSQAATLNGRIQDLTSNLNQSRNELNRARTNETRQESVVFRARDALDDAVRELGFAQGRVDSIRPSYLTAQAALQSEKQRANELYAYYQQVIANYNKALAQVYSQAENAGRSHARLEANDRAPDPARQEARTHANVAATEKANGDRAQRDFGLGYDKGLANGPTLAGSAYQSGVAQGGRRADAKALAEDFPRGYNEALKALAQAAPPGSETIRLQEGFPADPGGAGSYVAGQEMEVGSVQAPSFERPPTPVFTPPTVKDPSVVSPSPGFTHSSPPCSGLVLAEFEPLCRQRYRSTYRDYFADAYFSAYTAAYRAAFAVRAKAVYTNLIGKTDDSAMQAGIETGASDQGVLDGFAQSLSQAKTTQYQKGQQSLGTQLTSGYLLVYRSARLTDSNGDGVFAPGETLSLELTIDNYGQTPSPHRNLKVTFLSADGLKDVSVQEQPLPALSGETRTTVEGVLGADVATAKAGEKFALKARLSLEVNGSEVDLGMVELGETTHFPLELVDIALAGTPRVNEEVEAAFTYVNRTNRAFPGGDLQLSTAPNLVEVVEANPTSLGSVGEGDEVQVAVTLKPGIWVGENTDVNFVSKVTDADGVEISQTFPKGIQIERNASVRLFRFPGQPEPDATFEARAGGTVTFYGQFTYHAKGRLPGPFEIRAEKTSEPGLRLISNSTVAINYGPFWPGRQADPLRFTYRVPQSLKGKTGWVMLTAKEAGRVLHAQMVYIKVN